MDGVVNVYKPAGMTSHDVVYKIRRISGIKKVGHTGTLDPDAEGVLPICIGKATKAAETLASSYKRYSAVLRLGVTTDTQDIGGEVLKTNEISVSNDEIIGAVSAFEGEISQIPPMYSALKVGGKKLYKLARKGIEVERQPRRVTVYKINVLNIDGAKVGLDIKCSKGTYIRTLCHDIGERLGCGGCLERLVRTETSGFTLETAVSLESLESEGITPFLIPVDELFSYEKITVSGADEKKVKNGNSIQSDGLKEGACYRVYGSDGRFICISKQLNGRLIILKMFC
ncbi:MAG: tRNA pseudouridine synthase B [Firmicutes bacterium ADurb.Bin193]|nr:MAG: tRNA pseudouridine synthase B [Firmicutes bacterium ADurb.Bin193]